MRRSRSYSVFVLLAFILAGLLPATGCSRREQGTGAEKQALHNLIAGYFASWSKADMAAYQGCFHPLAAIYFVDGAGNPHYARLDEFIAGQERAHQAARQHQQSLTEKPTHVLLTVQGRLAQAEVRWELHRGSAVVTGTDYFTLIKTGAGWRILSLAFEEDKQ